MNRDADNRYVQNSILQLYYRFILFLVCDRFFTTGHKNWVLCIAWSPDGKHLVSGSKAGELICWDPKTGKPTGNSLVVSVILSKNFVLYGVATTCSLGDQSNWLSIPLGAWRVAV